MTITRIDLNAVIKVEVFENSLPLGLYRFYRICGVGKDSVWADSCYDGSLPDMNIQPGF